MAFLYDQDVVVADLSPTASGLSVDRTYVTPFLDQNLSMTDAGGNSFYYAADGLGSVRTLTDSSGAVVNRYAYSAFGEEYAAGTSVSLAQRYTYTGREKSPVGGPMYYRYRHKGEFRFLQRDPRLYSYNPYGNLYEYCFSSPAYFIDPSGLGIHRDEERRQYFGRRQDGYVGMTYDVTIDWILDCPTPCTSRYVYLATTGKVVGWFDKLDMAFLAGGGGVEITHTVRPETHSGPCPEGTRGVITTVVHWVKVSRIWGVGLSVGIGPVAVPVYYGKHKEVLDLFGMGRDRVECCDECCDESQGSPSQSQQ